MITEKLKRRVAIALVALGAVVWIAEMMYLGGAMVAFKAAFWP